MSVGEVIGIAVTAGVVGGLCGAGLLAFLLGRRRRDADLRARRVDSHARWLAARLALSRGAHSFVAAFRALAVEPRKSRTFTLRLEEAQRARNQWCEAVAHLELAEAELLAWNTEPALREQLALLERPSLGELRRAVRGDDGSADALAGRLKECDRRAMDLVAGRTGELLNGAVGWRRTLSATVWHLDDMLAGRNGSAPGSGDDPAR